jgi:hypothetical protein
VKRFASRTQKRVTALYADFFEGFEVVCNERRTGDYKVFNALLWQVLEDLLCVRRQPRQAAYS